ncbi:MAG: ABC transporter ATP-binding protein [Candidatus Eremiobacteraeota bacterium]|nr:ABC transporter ATP-binding protein [Candidatus Eremiobacteraeota bacterium]
MIRIENLYAEAGEFKLININLTIKKGEYFVLLGPTGAGKTVLIECIAGLQESKKGRVILEGTDVTDFLPEKRRVGFLPQDYSLFPHMNVRQNIEFALKISRIPAEEIKRRVDSLIELLQIVPLMDRDIFTLSGGEKQRIALARALVMRPQVVLLDEPLSALDEGLRSFLCKELKRIQKETGSTFIHISHNFEEAIDVADDIGIIHEGKIMQVGKMFDIMQNPANLFVAKFLMMENIFEGKAFNKNGLARVQVGNLNLYSASKKEGEVSAVIRPDNIIISGNGKGHFPENTLTGKVTNISERIGFIKINVDAGIPFVIYSNKRELQEKEIKEGREIRFSFDPSNIHILKD